MAHIRRGDWGFAAIAAMAKCVYWFNPLSWFLERQLSELADNASDDASISRTRDITRYAEILSNSPRPPRMADGFMKKRNSNGLNNRIQSRIERVHRRIQTGNGILKIAGWSLVIIIAIPVIYSAAAMQGRHKAPRQ
jgi:beta-lactamase regulating signal transducer with metallopeptidase domain